MLVSDVVPRPDNIKQSEVGVPHNPFSCATPPATYVKLLHILKLQRNKAPLWLFTVTADENEFCLLCALAQGNGIRPEEDGFETYQSCVVQTVVTAAKIGMLDHQSGSKRDTPLMKACANGAGVVVRELIKARARSPHLG